MTFDDGWNFQLGSIAADFAFAIAFCIAWMVVVIAIILVTKELDDYNAKRGRWKHRAKP